MDQHPNSSREFENRFLLNISKNNFSSNSVEEENQTVNMINNENDKTVTNIRFQDFMNMSKIDEINKKDIKSFFDVEEEVQDTYQNIINKSDKNLIVDSNIFQFQCKHCRISVGSDSKSFPNIILVRLGQL